MNREQRRNLSKKGQENMEFLNSPCTITEAVQIAKGVSEDTITDYQKRTSPLQVALSLQMEILKEAIISSGIISEESFKEQYMSMAEEFNKKQKEYQEDEGAPDNVTSMETKVNDLDVKIEKR